jgi:hypothetical protein
LLNYHGVSIVEEATIGLKKIIYFEGTEELKREKKATTAQSM